MTNEKFDYIVVGAGLLGLSSAYYLKKFMPDKTVKVVEKESTYSQGNSGRSVAGYRDLFSTEVNFKLAEASIGFYRHIQNDLGYDIDMRYVGYLFLMSSRKYKAMKHIIENMQKRTRIRILTKKEIAKIDPLIPNPQGREAELLELEPMDFGILGQNCGVLEVDKLSKFYYDSCRDLGVEFSFGTEVTNVKITPLNSIGYPGEPFLWQKKKISGIETNKSMLIADRVIFATGAWTGKLLDSIGVDSHIRVKKRFVYQIGGSVVRNIVNSSYGLNNESIFPLVVLPSYGIYLRPHPPSGTFWVTTSGTTSDQEIGKTFSYEPPEKIEYIDPDQEYFVTNILPVIREYLKGFDDIKITGRWTGYYSLSTQDKTPYIFPFLNGIVATGGSGAGLMKADSIGRIVASIVSGKKRTTLFNGSIITNSNLGMEDRNVGIEKLRF